MSLLNTIKLYISFFLRKLKVVNDSVNIHPTSKIDSSSYFEGGNKVYHHSSLLNSSLGFGTYIGWSSVLNNCSFGKYCSIAPYVEVIYGRHPTSGFLSTHPAFFSVSRQAGFTYVDHTIFEEHKYTNAHNKISCEVGNDVWIGSHVKIIEGVRIGDGAIIAAGSVVTKDVEPFSIYGGNPAKLIRMRFNDKQINAIVKSPWWNEDPEWIKENIAIFKGDKWSN